MEGRVEFRCRYPSYRLPIRRFGDHGRLHSGELLRRFWGLNLCKVGVDLVSIFILRGGMFFFTGEDVALQAADTLVAGIWLRVVSG